MEKKINIAIDGYSSCGKSTLAKQLAKHLGYIYVDSGAMYRAIALYCLRKGYIKDNFIMKDELIADLGKISIRFHYNSDTQRSETFLNGENVESEIRGMEVSKHVSYISLIKEVRRKLVVFQHEMGKNKGVVMDGRDIGTVVFPDAELKIFMTADKHTRAERRYEELKAKGLNITMDEVAENLYMRDFEDTTREENPLRQAEDARVIDNTFLTHEEQLKLAMDWAEQIIK
ncbi:MAG: (d)CMP kinase [Bacteroidota bacterium]